MTGVDLETSDDLETDEDEEKLVMIKIRVIHVLRVAPKKVYIDLNRYFKTVQRFGKIYLIKLLLFWVTTVN